MKSVFSFVLLFVLTFSFAQKKRATTLNKYLDKSIAYFKFKDSAFSKESNFLQVGFQRTHFDSDPITTYGIHISRGKKNNNGASISYSEKLFYEELVYKGMNMILYTENVDDMKVALAHISGISEGKYFVDYWRPSPNVVYCPFVLSFYLDKDFKSSYDTFENLEPPDSIWNKK